MPTWNADQFRYIDTNLTFFTLCITFILNLGTAFQTLSSPPFAVVFSILLENKDLASIGPDKKIVKVGKFVQMRYNIMLLHNQTDSHGCKTIEYRYSHTYGFVAKISGGQTV